MKRKYYRYTHEHMKTLGLKQSDCPMGVIETHHFASHKAQKNHYRKFFGAPKPHSTRKPFNIDIRKLKRQQRKAIE